MPEPGPSERNRNDSPRTGHEAAALAADIMGPANGKRPRAIWFYGLKAVVAAGLLFFLVRTISLPALVDALRRADPRLLTPVFLLMALNLYLQAARWRLLAGTEAQDLTFRRAFASLVGGFTFGLITPGRVGEVGRVLLLQAPSRWRLAGLHVLDKLYFFGLVALTGPFMIFWMPGFREALPAEAGRGVGILVTLLPLLYLFFAVNPKPLKGLLVAIQLAYPGRKRLLELLGAFEGLKLRHTLRALGYTLIQFIVILVQFALLSRAFQPVSWVTAGHTYAATLFVKIALPISLGNLGVGEWAAVSFYQRYGIADTTAFGASLLLFGINVLLPSLAGLAVLLRLRPAALGMRKANAREEAA